MTDAQGRTNSRYPALEMWRDELHRGVRTMTTFDVLWRAACFEAIAQEFADIPELHEALTADARAVIETAVRQGR